MCVGVTARLQQIEFEVLDRGISEHESIWIKVFLNTKVLDWNIYEDENIGLKYVWTQKYWVEVFMNTKILDWSIFEHESIGLKY